MTEQEWLTCADPEPMLEFLRGKVSDRKLRLFAVACCRSIWNSLSDQRSQTTVKVAEKFADGQANGSELSEACSLAHSAAWAARFLNGKEVTGDEEALRRVRHQFFAAYMAVSAQRLPNEMRMLSTDPELHSSSPVLFRCVFGNPFCTIAIEPFWLSPTVVSLATAIYNDRAFDRLPILGDALEDAGCTYPDILAHCRSAGLHVRGCWPVDLLLGKQ